MIRSKLKPCPLCGGKRVRARDYDHGIECLDCGLWLGGGTLALNTWRELRGDPYLVTENGWLVEVWNDRAVGED